MAGDHMNSVLVVPTIRPIEDLKGYRAVAKIPGERTLYAKDNCKRCHGKGISGYLGGTRKQIDFLKAVQEADTQAIRCGCIRIGGVINL